MAFWNKKDEELPESLRNMTPEELVAAVSEGKELKSKVATLEAANETSNALLEEVKLKLADIEAGNDPNKNKPDPNAGKLTDFLVDPDRAFAERMMPLAAMTMETNKKVARAEAQRKLGQLFTKWESEIDGEAARMPLATLGNPGTWENLFYLVKGRHAEEKDAFVVEGAAGSGDKPPVKTDDDVLTDQEKRVASKMHIDEKVYLENKKKARLFAEKGVTAHV